MMKQTNKKGKVQKGFQITRSKRANLVRDALVRWRAILWTFHFKFTFLFMKKESAEIHEYLSDNENEGSLVGADY